MIQRIQSVYLLLITALCIWAASAPVGVFTQDGLPVAEMNNLWLTYADGVRSYAPWAMFVLLALAALLSFTAIFLFRRRMLQVRLCIFTGLLLIGYYIAYGAFIYIIGQQSEASFTLSWTTSFPAVSLILTYLAFRAVMRDELIVRSLDRLR
ncbi:MAG: DUF4293 domain-containing protein [Paraprevotella sp.]|nr:DUF4293 domain-containing protein [Paraprevotella sp.]